MPAKEDFRSAARRDLALAFSGEPRTLYEASKALGRPTGSIAGLAKRMLAEGLLSADGDPPVRGTLYRLHPAAEEALEQALAQKQPTGLLQPHQRLLLVQGEDALRRWNVLARSSLSATVSWAAEIDGSGRLLLAMAPDASSLQVENLLVALQAAGLVCEPRQVGDLWGAEDLRRRARAHLETAEVTQRALGPREAATRLGRS